MLFSPPGPIFSNLTQCRRGREIVCDPTKQILTKILPFTLLHDKLIRRGGATGVLKNICFDSARHDWLLSDDLNVLPFILLPLAGPEEYSEEDNDKFPMELQVSDVVCTVGCVPCIIAIAFGSHSTWTQTNNGSRM